MKFVRDELGRIYPLCQSTYSEVYLYLRFVLETNEKTLFHKKKKKVASKGTKRVCLFRAKDVPPESGGAACIVCMWLLMRYFGRWILTKLPYSTANIQLSI